MMALTVLTGCSKSKLALDTAVLTPLINARHTADNSIRSLKELYCDHAPTSVKVSPTNLNDKAALSASDDKAALSASDDKAAVPKSDDKVVLSDSEQICRQARLRYNRTATSINTVLSQLAFAIESNSNIANDRLFKQELERSITSAFELEKFLEENLSHPAFLSGLPLLFNVAAVIDSLVGAIPQFSTSVSQADAAQKEFIVCELKALKLQPFDTLEQTVTPAANCSALLATSR
jgi:hypothetical protein